MEDRLVPGFGSYYSSVALVNLPNKHLLIEARVHGTGSAA